MSNNNFYSGGFVRNIFPDWLELAPNTNQLWELEMAYGEMRTLESKEKLIERSAFFSHVDGEETFHYKVCQGSPLQVDKTSSLRRQTFFDANQFKTGYATHGLFPYRGKFHGQLVKGILNIIRVKKGETVLDPMAGSGSLCIEAAINGIHSIGMDVSPFCALMTRAKTQALQVSIQELREAMETGLSEMPVIHKPVLQPSLFDTDYQPVKPVIESQEQEKYRDIVLLAYLDAMGYAARRKNKTAQGLLPVIADRYLAAIEQFQVVREELVLEIGRVDARTADARQLDIPDNSMDGIVTSPPYSFAIDYAENDKPQLEFLGYDTDELKETMVGLSGGESVKSRVKQYFEDMRTIFHEMARVLKPGRCCVVVIGSNEKQTGGIRHEEKFARFGQEVGFDLFWNMVRPIQGIRNSMRDEYVMFFRKRG